MPKVRGTRYWPPPFFGPLCPPSAPYPLLIPPFLNTPQYPPTPSHCPPHSNSVWSLLPRWPLLPVPAAPALPGKWGILAKGAAPTRSSLPPSPFPLGRWTIKRGLRPAEPSSLHPTDGCAPPHPPPVPLARSLPQAGGQRPVPAEPRHCLPHSPRGAEESPCRPHARPPSSCCTWSCSPGSEQAPRPAPRVSGFPRSPLQLTRRPPEIAWGAGFASTALSAWVPAVPSPLSSPWARIEVHRDWK